MKHVFSISCAAFMSLVLLVASCKKGDTGPQGPEGPQGNQGPQGPEGKTNVITSGWKDITFTAVTNQAGDTTYYYQAQIPATKLTKAILDSGEIKAYVNLGTVGEPYVYPLPWLGSSAYIDVEYVVGNINLYSSGNASTSGTGNNKGLQYRYILIPGSTNARSAINWNNYAEVQKYLGLKD